MSQTCQPPIQPLSSESEKQHPRYGDYAAYRGAMDGQLVRASSFVLWLEDTEKHENGSVTVYKVMPGAMLAAGWWKNVFGPAHQLLEQLGPFNTEAEAESA